MNNRPARFRRMVFVAGWAALLLLSSCVTTDLELPEHLGALRIRPEPGTISDSDPVVTIESPDAGVGIKYTTDGTDPINSATARIYSEPLHLRGRGIVTVKAYGKRDGERSPMASARYLFPVPWDSTAQGYGTLVARGRVYRTVVLGSRTWMAENLNDAGASGNTGVCLHDDLEYCSVYGRLYTWAEAIGASSMFNTTKYGGPDVLRQGVCPSGWHVPNRAEWMDLVDWVNRTTGLQTPGSFLKSRWVWTEVNGTDAFGFRMIPAGSRRSPVEYEPGKFTAASQVEPGGSALFWTATESDTAEQARAVNFPGMTGEIMDSRSPKADAMGVRCVQNP